MPKRRTLTPESVFSRRNLEKWLQDEWDTKIAHRNRIWKHYRGDISSVADIPQVVKNEFNSKFVLTTSRIVETKQSEHGMKLVIQLQDDHLIETVIIRHTSDRSTVCVSSQVGCQMGCTFCATGLLGKIANLTDGEIVEQVYHARECDPNVTGVVFMGMGGKLMWCCLRYYRQSTSYYWCIFRT